MIAKRVKIELNVLIPIHGELRKEFDDGYIKGYLKKSAEFIVEDFGRVIEDHGYELEQSATEIG